MFRFDYLEARNLRHAIALAEEHGDQARIVAGSTDFLVRWRQGTWRPKYVISIGNVAALKRISFNTRSGLRSGSLVTVSELQTNPIIRQRVRAEVKIALGAVAPTPIRAYAAEDALRGQTITPLLLTKAAQQAQSCASPIDDVRGSAAHRKDIVGVLVLRTLERAIAMAKTSPISFEAQRRLAVEAAV